MSGRSPKNLDERMSSAGLAQQQPPLPNKAKRYRRRLHYSAIPTTTSDPVLEGTGGDNDQNPDTMSDQHHARQTTQFVKPNRARNSVRNNRLAPSAAAIEACTESKNIRFYDANKMIQNRSFSPFEQTRAEVKIVPSSRGINNTTLTAWGTKAVPVIDRFDEVNVNRHTKLLVASDDIKSASISKWICQVNEQLIFKRESSNVANVNNIMDKLSLNNNMNHSLSRRCLNKC